METVVLLSTDVEGSTRAWATSPGMVRSLERHDALLRESFAGHGGIEFKHTGDGLWATFPSVADAVLAAIDAQRALDATDWEDGPPLRVRVAIHAGTAHRRGDDWFGLSLSRCRGSWVPHTVGRWWSRAPQAPCSRRCPPRVRRSSTSGGSGCRDFPEPEQVWQVTADGLDGVFPLLRALSSTKGNLPSDLSRLVGREAQVTQISDVLATARLVTLTGPGGVGKTRLALAVARAVGPDFSSGAWFIELASARAEREVEQIVAGGLGFMASRDASVSQSIIDGIGGRRLLVVLDNCEHVLDEVASLVESMLRHCDALSIITTSREPLGVHGERIVVVPSLAVATEAVELFVSRAIAAEPAFEADPEIVEEICRRLDGIPLALELAAAGARTLRLAEIAGRLRDHVDIVTAGRRGRLERHATVRAAIDWSWGLLEDQERVAFARLSVFAGGFDLEAASAAISDAGSVDTVEVMSALVDKSMVQVDARGLAPFRVLEPLRQYGIERLAERGEVNDTALRHAEHYAALVGRLSERYESADELDAGRRLDAVRDNLRAAFAFAVAGDDVDLAFRLVVPLAGYSQGRVWPEPWGWSETALSLSGADLHPLRHGALIHAGQGAWQLGDQQRALGCADEALSLSEEGTERWREGQRLRAYALVFLGRFEEANAAAIEAVGDLSADVTPTATRSLITALMIRNLLVGPDVPASLELVKRSSTRSPSTHALALHNAGLAVAATDPGAALEFQRQAAELTAATGDVLIHGFALVGIAALEAAADPTRGVKAFADVMAHYVRVGNRTHLREFARGAVVPLSQCEQWEPAATVEGATRSSALFQTTLGEALPGAIAQACSAIGEVEYDSAAARGAAMTDDELVSDVERVAAGL